MTLAKGGPPTKDREITENFNKEKLGIKKRDMSRAQRQAIAEKAIERIRKQLRTGSKRKSLECSEPNPTEEKPDIPQSTQEALKPEQKKKTPPPEEDDDLGSARQMIDDMRWVYKQLRGKNKLKELMEGDKEFVTLVKELMKIEAAIMTSKLKREDATGSGAPGFFVVLKGLETDTDIVKAMKNKAADIDLSQLERALNPNADLLGGTTDDEQPGENIPEQLRRMATEEDNWDA